MQIDQDSQSLSALSFALYALETEIEGLGDLFQPAAEIRAVRSAERAQVCLPCLAGQVDVRTAVGFHLERAVAVPVLERPRETPCRGRLSELSQRQLEFAIREILGEATDRLRLLAAA